MYMPHLLAVLLQWHLYAPRNIEIQIPLKFAADLLPQWRCKKNVSNKTWAAFGGDDNGRCGFTKDVAFAPM